MPEKRAQSLKFYMADAQPKHARRGGRAGGLRAPKGEGSSRGEWKSWLEGNAIQIHVLALTSKSTDGVMDSRLHFYVKAPRFESRTSHFHMLTEKLLNCLASMSYLRKLKIGGRFSRSRRRP